MRHARIESFYRAASDAVCWVLSLLVASLLRFEFQITVTPWWPTLILAISTATAFVCLGYAFGLYKGKYDYGGFEETRPVLFTTGVIAIGYSLLLLTAVIQRGPPRGLHIVGILSAA